MRAELHPAPRPAGPALASAAGGSRDDAGDAAGASAERPAGPQRRVGSTPGPQGWRGERVRDSRPAAGRGGGSR